MRAFERLIKYAAVHTASSENGDSTPSTDRQFAFARMLEKELKELGAQDVFVDEHCYVYASVPASEGCESAPCVGFIAHLDTVPDFSGENVRPRIVKNYDGGDIPLGESGRTLRPAEFPHLKELVGEDVIVTDGTTVLGADDKAGVAEIMTAAEQLLAGGIRHGRIAIGFCPDEEIGHGASLMDLERLGAQLAYTVDGAGPGVIEYENFNAAAADIDIKGFNVHPGSAKNTMINAALVAMEFNSMLPAGDTPRHTEGYEGFFHLTSMSGDIEKAHLSYIIRDHDAQGFEARKRLMLHAEKLLCEKYGQGTVSVKITEQYRNMKEVMAGHMEVVEKAMDAMRALGREPKAEPIRGGTDGAQLSFRGLPCPNLPTGSFGHHGPYEHAVVRYMDECTRLLINIAVGFAD